MRSSIGPSVLTINDQLSGVAAALSTVTGLAVEMYGPTGR